MSTIGGVSARAELDEHVAARLRAANQRVTAPRRALVDVLARAKRPLTIPELRQRAPGLATSSAYRNLGVLEDVGVVHRIVTSGDHARYELAEDLTEHHHHLICSACGAAIEVDDALLVPLRERLLREHGFRADVTHMALFGTCRACLEAVHAGEQGEA